MFIKSYSAIQRNLIEACKWAGVAQGRTNDYQKHIEQLHVQNTKSRNALLCTTDVIDIPDIYETWKVHANNFPGISKRIRKMSEKGSTIPEDAKYQNSR